MQLSVHHMHVPILDAGSEVLDVDDDFDDEAAERLLMLLTASRTTACVDEVLAGVASCYSAQVLRHASSGGDSSMLHSLPQEVNVALRAYLSQPAVKAELDGTPANTERANLVSLLKTMLPQDPQQTSEPGASAASELLLHEKMLSPLADEIDASEISSKTEKELEWGALSSDESDAHSDGGDGRPTASNGAGVAREDATEEAEEEEGYDDDDGQVSRQLRAPAWTRPARTRRVAQDACASPAKVLVDKSELGWRTVDQNESVDTAAGTAAAQQMSTQEYTANESGHRTPPRPSSPVAVSHADTTTPAMSMMQAPWDNGPEDMTRWLPPHLQLPPQDDEDEHEDEEEPDEGGELAEILSSGMKPDAPSEEGAGIDGGGSTYTDRQSGRNNDLAQAVLSVVEAGASPVKAMWSWATSPSSNTSTAHLEDEEGRRRADANAKFGGVLGEPDAGELQGSNLPWLQR